VDESARLLDYRIYRSIVSAHREIVSNIIRHAQAKRVDVIATEQDRTLSITITDDGVGIDPASANGSAQGNGLRGIIRRLGDLGGSFAALPAARGSAFEIRIPLVAETVATDEPHIRGVPSPSGSSYSPPADAAQRTFDRS
jgi:signal transduction histidine kinase